MSAEITEGQATVILSGYEISSGTGVVHITYDFDNVLGAVSQLAGAVLHPSSASLVRASLDELRKELRNG